MVGAVCDAANAVGYAAKGDWKNAGLSALGAVPGLGDAATAVGVGDGQWLVHNDCEPVLEQSLGMGFSFGTLWV